MPEFGRSIFWSLLAEIFFVGLAFVLKDDKRKVVAVLAVGTLFAGVIGFGQSIYEFLTENVPPLPIISFPTQQPTPEYINVSLKAYSELTEAETNLGLAPGLNYLLDIPFETGWKASTQCSHLQNQPETFELPTNINSPTEVYLLIQAGWGLVQYNGLQIGFVRLGFSDGSTTDTPLTLGENIRDWAWESSAAVRTVSSSSSRPAWTGYAPDGTPGGMDILTIDIPSNKQNLDLTSILISDISQVTAGNVNPCIHVVALTVLHLR